ncbi:MAG TPA: selenium metabolism-associated LysR family transcriptional regulator [Desulfohalobiaceae bacterium]|nr:selenium metabolism-associated LysR family transcriptional regulator [Desulfohalobiaceae bacterium]
MDIYRLATFCKVFELKSFSKAAQELLLSQPTVSAHIANIENELNILLFDRVGREILSTKAGEILYSHAKSITWMLNQAITEMQTMQGQVAGELFIGGSTIPGQYFLPIILHKYKMYYKDVSPHLIIYDSSHIMHEVLGGNLDIGVVGGIEDHPDLLFEHVLTDELVVLRPISPTDHSDNELDRKSLVSLPWILREKGSGTRKALEVGLSQLDLTLNDLNIVAEVYSTEAVLQCIRSGMGVSVTSKMAADRLIKNKECSTLNSPWMKLDRSFHMVTHRQRGIFPATSKFMEIIRDYCQKIQHCSMSFVCKQ